MRFTSTTEADWSLAEVRDAIASERLLYIGKYRAPDYEVLLSEGCPLALENTMIFHNPATKEQLEALGIPVTTFKNRLHRARKALRKTLDREVTFE